ncbi:MAG TPA: 50S ribosomal protein L4, partial [Candidatus Saccharimonadales bacterium]
DRVWVVDSLITTGKTTDLTKFLNKIGFKTGLLIVDEVTAELKRASSNIPGVQPIAIAKLSTADVLGNNQLMFTKPALAALSSRLGAKS